MYETRIAVIGLGNLGLPLALLLHNIGYPIIGVDKDLSKLRAFNVDKSFQATNNHLYAVKHSDIAFVLLNTGTANGYDVHKLDGALHSLREAIIENGKKEYCVVIVSTVLLGDMRRSVKLFFNDLNVNLLYNPIFPATNTAYEDLANPDFIVIGEETQGDGVVLGKLYHSFTDAPVKCVSWENAELIKLAVNFYCCMKISFANVLTETCEGFKGGNVDLITEILGLDKRVNPKFLKGGLGYGGPCFPWDPQSFIKSASYPHLGFTVHKINQRQLERVTNLINQNLPENGKVTIIGLTYKLGARSLVGSQSAIILQHLLDKDINVVCYDPTVKLCETSLKDCLKNSDVVLVALPYPRLQELTVKDFKEGSTIIDCWRTLHLNLDLEKKQVKYIGLGIGISEVES